MLRREEFHVSGPASLDVHSRSGSVEVRVGAAGRVVVTIDGGSADSWEVVQVGDSVSVRPGGRGGGWRSRSTRVHVDVPEGCDVDVSTASADVVGVGDLGDLRVRTASGDVRVDRARRLDASTASGDVRVHEVGSDASCSTMSGDVDLRTVGGRLRASTASGGVRVAQVGEAVDVGTASGDVSLHCCDGDEVSVKCVSGDISLGLPSGIRVEPDISTLSGKTMLPSKASSGLHDGGRRTVRVRLRTVSGDVRIARAT
ncbi:MAG: DUF4097 family beta strand repeat-containing protein [Ilumatobacter sp.]|uniref:DUF4097 family beta strand repeat-containing protein n=1 Tax=Ilumatobacter sp. TaxID=1967498 RepID=UPI002627272B|nr:DUF4097 family beta strand repeat-containing protein [Ilumatobacter sp.]MDJ0767792.1 DUF4097 family beta strand repeat-containing protein [Ilumatobacter sp.]